MNDEAAVFQNEDSPAGSPCDTVEKETAQTEYAQPVDEGSPQALPCEAEKADLLFADPRTDPDTDSEGIDPSLEADRLEQLRGELAELRQQIAERNAALARYLHAENDYAEFCELYPDVPVSALSEELWQSVKGGNSLAAAYALQERKETLRAKKAAESNAANRARSAGAVKQAEAFELSPAEVRAMSPAEVRQNLTKIMRSMQKWN